MQHVRFATEAAPPAILRLPEVMRLTGLGRSTIYRLLERHGWRKVVPRPRHPKADVAAQAAFKKTAPRGTPRGLAPG